MVKFLEAIAPYRGLFLFLFYILILAALITLAFAIIDKWKKENEESAKRGDKYAIKLDFDGKNGVVERQNAIRQILSPDGVDPSANTYLAISDGGKELYVRSVTISRLPKRVEFDKTFRELFSYPNCTSTVFVEPVDSETISRKIDKQITLLESEEISSDGNTNRVRRLSSQRQRAEQLAYEVEGGEKRFFNVGFLFTFVAESVEELNHITDDFRILALGRKMDISNCYAVQSEAFLANLPLNRRGSVMFGRIDNDCIKSFLLDQQALSVVLNYTSDHYTHKHGIPLGRGLFSGLPFIFDIFDPSHFGYTVVIAGKTSSGKSATIKMMIQRYVPLGYRFVIIDSQARKGTSGGEYESTAIVNGGVNIQISSRSENVLNLFNLQKSVEWVSTDNSSGYEQDTLDLNGAITDIVYNLRTLIRGNMQAKASGSDDMQYDAVMDSDINDILTRITKALYAERGIEHGNAESLYEDGSAVRNGVITGKTKKELPTISDFFARLVKERALNREPALENVYRFVMTNIRENVRELYYMDSGRVFTREEFESLPVNEERPDERLCNGEAVYALHGIRPYYDGQATFDISSMDCPVTNIDISQLTEVERRSARDIALHTVDQEFVQKNSERLDSSRKLVVVIDEAHESFGDPSARSLLAGEVRTARKRNCSILFSTQTVAEFGRYPETKDILEQAAVKMVFKQDVADIDELIKPLNITESQANIIMNRLGVSSDRDDTAEQARHKGEMCVIDGGQVQFVKVDYLKKTEALSVETDASTVMRAVAK